MAYGETANSRVDAADGRRYEGGYKDDKMHGRGCMVYPDGRKEDGIWRNDTFMSSHRDRPIPHRSGTGFQSGIGKWVWSNGNAYEGGWSNGKMHGRGVYTFSDGAPYEGGFKDGKKNGRGVFTWPD